MVAKVLGLMKDKVNRTVYINGLSGGEVSESSDEASMSDDVGVESMRKTLGQFGDPRVPFGNCSEPGSVVQQVEFFQLRGDGCSINSLIRRGF